MSRIAPSAVLSGAAFVAAACLFAPAPAVAAANAQQPDAATKAVVRRGLDYLARTQSQQGYWAAGNGGYRAAMTALAGTALLAEGSTTTRGRYAPNVRRAVDYLLSVSRSNGLIGSESDSHYTYGHGFGMLFLAQVYGEEEDRERREELKGVLNRAVKFTIAAQTSRGGWGYVSAKEGNDFDEGSTCVTQVQGLRACRNAGIPVPKDVIDRANKYIRDCMTPEGGVQYSIKGGGARPAISGAAIACLFSAGEQDDPMAQKLMEYCEKNIWPADGGASAGYGGYWHYKHFYYAQVMYRDPERWPKYRDFIAGQIRPKQTTGGPNDGAFVDGRIGPAYVTAMNCTILQLDNGFLPIYQR
ncbi:prenyltransferase/squalene oxidase repeat-containing protein [Alienimonas sp. DA493]|uniref:prenyltransferase/squalene oxidase repeat-containing protein n=1 Tax=Alienimonas sp. DA493 TaxID=3373605 RepID=UPI003754477D